MAVSAVRKGGRGLAYRAAPDFEVVAVQRGSRRAVGRRSAAWRSGDTPTRDILAQVSVIIKLLAGWVKPSSRCRGVPPPG